MLPHVGLASDFHPSFPGTQLFLPFSCLLFSFPLSSFTFNFSFPPLVCWESQQRQREGRLGEGGNLEVVDVKGNADGVGNCQQVQHGVGGAPQRHHQRDRVLKAALRHHVPRLHIPPQQLQHGTAPAPRIPPPFHTLYSFMLPSHHLVTPPLSTDLHLRCRQSNTFSVDRVTFLLPTELHLRRRQSYTSNRQPYTFITYSYTLTADRVRP
jgi:hypothetical protein